MRGLPSNFLADAKQSVRHTRNRSLSLVAAADFKCISMLRAKSKYTSVEARICVESLMIGMGRFTLPSLGDMVAETAVP